MYYTEPNVRSILSLARCNKLTAFSSSSSFCVVYLAPRQWYRRAQRMDRFIQGMAHCIPVFGLTPRYTNTPVDFLNRASLS
jgi:hypothetical protein